MDDTEKEIDEFALHKSVFDNDLKKLTQILKSNKEIVDKKVQFRNTFVSCNRQSFFVCIHQFVFIYFFYRINMETPLCTLQLPQVD